MDCRILSISIVLLCLVRPGSAVNLPSTTSFGFDSSSQGWMGTTGTKDIPTYWISGGGNPTGHMRFGDAGNAPGYAQAPAEFLGNWSTLNGSMIKFDAVNLTTWTMSRPPTVYLYSGLLSAALQNGPLPGLNWTHYEVPLTAATAHLSDADWSTLLSNVTRVWIDVDLSAHTGDTLGLDNIHVTPEPAGVTFISLGLGILACTRRRLSSLAN